MSELELKTRDYWLLSLVYNDRIKTNVITTEFALRKLGKLGRELSEHRPLHHRVVRLTDEIIIGVACVKPSEQKRLTHQAVAYLPAPKRKRTMIVRPKPGREVYNNEAGMVIIDDVGA
jgi:hypothetical protein